MQHLGIEKFSIIGLSVGGMWGTQMALDYPKQVTALMIMNTFVGDEPEESQQAYMGLIDTFKKARGLKEIT